MYTLGTGIINSHVLYNYKSVLLISEDDLFVIGGFLVSSTCAGFFFWGKKQTSLTSQSDKCGVHCTWKQNNNKINARVVPALVRSDLSD